MPAIGSCGFMHDFTYPAENYAAFVWETEGQKLLIPMSDVSKAMDQFDTPQQVIEHLKKRVRFYREMPQGGR